MSSDYLKQVVTHNINQARTHADQKKRWCFGKLAIVSTEVANHPQTPEEEMNTTIEKRDSQHKRKR